jgi:hypothetical protein
MNSVAMVETFALWEITIRSKVKLDKWSGSAAGRQEGYLPEP